MSEINPVYQVYFLSGKWIDVTEHRFNIIKKEGKFETRILYHAAAYEALQKENADLQDKYDDVTSQEHSMPELRKQLLDSFDEKQKAWDCIERLTISVTNTVKERDDLKEINAAQVKRIEEAVSRIKDILENDDGQAYKEARKFIKSLSASENGK